MISLEFLLTSLIVILIPGTGVIYTVSTGLTQGRNSSIQAAFGCTLGIIPHLLATILGLASIMHTSALAFQILRYAGVAYLFYIAFTTWRDKSAFAIDQSTPGNSVSGFITKGFLLNILNPKLTIFFLAFLPQFIGPKFIGPKSDQALLQLFLLSGIFMVMTIIVFVIYGLMAHAFRARVMESPSVQHWLRYSFASVFAALGTRLALSEK